jgi:hypothetical protein
MQFEHAPGVRSVDFTPKELDEIRRLCELPNFTGKKDWITLLPEQLYALAELRRNHSIRDGRGGLLGILGVGTGKTLVTFLAPVVVPNIKRPLLLVPAHLRDHKTQHDLDYYGQFFRLAKNLEVRSYQELSRQKMADFLDFFDPDMIIMDECHFVKNVDTAACNRINRFFMRNIGMKQRTKNNQSDENKTPLVAPPPSKKVFISVSGTVTDSTVRHYAHQCAWACTPQYSPLPTTTAELDRYCKYLDVEFKLDTGGVSEEVKKEHRVRYQEYLKNSNGIQVHLRSSCNASLTINQLAYPLTDKTDKAIKEFQKTKIRMDGKLIDTGLEARMVLHQMLCGFYYVFDPEPPPAWRDARSAWFRLASSVMEEHLDIDTEEQAKFWIIRNGNEKQRGIIDNWAEHRKSFKTNTVPVWFDEDQAMLPIKKYMKHSEPTIVWCSFIAHGDRLAKLTGLEYYGEGGLFGDKYIEDTKAKLILARIGPNATGRNLQKNFCHNVLLSPPRSAMLMEQLIGRTHRQGSRFDEVGCDVLLSSYTKKDWQFCYKRALFLKDHLGMEHKMCLATYPDGFPNEVSLYE